MKTKNKLRLAVDIDGTLTIADKKHRGWDDEQCLTAKPNQVMIDIVNNAWKAGHLIILYTARRWSRREATVYWLQKHDVKYHTIDMGSKPNVDYFIDDLALNAKDLKKIKKILC